MKEFKAVDYEVYLDLVEPQKDEVSGHEFKTIVQPFGESEYDEALKYAVEMSQDEQFKSVEMYKVEKQYTQLEIK